MNSIATQIIYMQSLPSISELGGKHTIIIYDKKLEKLSASFKNWKKKFEFSFGISSGENTKSLIFFTQFISKFHKQIFHLSSREMHIVVVGGGSIGDFGGFLASIYKRGVKLVHIPSTWLAAIDSSHGGKTALNLLNSKNQIGTIYPADKVYVVKSLLLSQPEIRAVEAYGELVKMGLICGGKLWSNLKLAKVINNQLIWNNIKYAINGKYSIVKKDLFEKNNIRIKLNLGHTLGHALETYYKIPHGIAVNCGVGFALNWSYHSKVLAKPLTFPFQIKLVVTKGKSNSKNSALIKSPTDWINSSAFSKIRINNNSVDALVKLIGQDKKKSKDGKINFLFVKKPGQVVIRKVKPLEIKRELRRQLELGQC